MPKNRKRNKNSLVIRVMRKRFFFGALVTLLVATMAVGVVEAADADEGKIVFVSAGNIHIINPDGTGEKRLTEGFVPFWSPDGKKIVFLGSFDDEFRYYIMNADGSNIIPLTEEDIGKFVPSLPPFLSNRSGSPLPEEALLLRHVWTAWSPDGKKIAYTDVGGVLCVSDADGTNKIKLAELGMWAGDIFGGQAWSPDGKKIAFFSPALTMEIKFELFTVNPDGTGKVKITDKGGYKVGPPSWSPDGKRIVFSAGRGGEGDGDIYIINADGSGLTKLAYGSFPRWSPISLGKPIITPTPTVAPTLPIRVPVGGTPAPEEGEKGVPGFEVVLAIAGLLTVVYLLKKK